MTRNIYYICPNWEYPVGGEKKIYQHVDVLCELGYSAYVVHSKLGMRLDWFKNNTPLAYMVSMQEPLMTIDDKGEVSLLPLISEEDIIVVPELMAFKFASSIQDRYFVIFNQGAYLTFNKLSIPSVPFHAGNDLFEQLPYRHPNLLGTMVVSEDSADYLRFIVKDLELYRIHNSIDYSNFFYESEKKKRIAFMPRKCPEDVVQVIKILQERNQLKDWMFCPIEDMPEEDVASIMRECAIFLSFSYEEGLPLPPYEAMACGCTVIGYHGQGGKEYFHQPYAFPVPQCDVMAFVKEVERIALDYEKNPELYSKCSRISSEYIHHNYSTDREKEDLQNAWKAIEQKHKSKMESKENAPVK